MNSTAAEELSQIKKDLVKVQILGVPGIIFIGLGLYGIFGAQGDAFLPFLNNVNNSYALLAAGGALTVWESIKVIKLNRRQAELNKQLNT